MQKFDMDQDVLAPKCRGLADLLSSEVASRLVKILEEIDLFDIQAASTLARLAYKSSKAIEVLIHELSEMKQDMDEAGLKHLLCDLLRVNDVQEGIH
ncbi:hypothetical protein ACET3Z_024534 [Daucus carota]